MNLRNSPTFSLLFLVVLLLVPACKESTEPENSTRKLLTGYSWKLQKAFAIDPASGQKTDITSSYPPLTLTFGSDGTYISTLQSGIWELIENDTKILFDKNRSSQTTADILELTNSSFRMKLSLPVGREVTPLELTFVPTGTPVTSNSPELNFETLWREFDTRYSFFEIKHINWDSLYSVYRPQVTSQTTGAQLFQIMSSLFDHLKDGHVSLVTSFRSYYYTGWYSRYPSNFLGSSVIAQYLSVDYGTLAGGYLRYGKIGNDLGYLYIGPNLTGDATIWTQATDRILDSLKNAQGIIIDIRNNGGGNSALGEIVASRFTGQPITYSYVRWRNGPKHSDFTDFQTAPVNPRGTWQYTKPVTLLTNRRCFSSAEGTILMFRVMPHVTVIGDTTGGGSANTISLQLPNGWAYRVSRWIQYTAEKTVFEGTGLPPTIPLWITPADSAAGRDAILERAIQHLRNR